ncbi:MAG TPA: serine hydrolase [Candidatus Saccharimonadales bacterium]|nr:serine hydrolase [Candidatus Saccharimonadales bacterium]
MFKYKSKFFNTGRSTYFHHRYGVIFRKNRFRAMALHASTLLVVGGGFFTVTNLAIPAIKHIGALQSRQTIDVDSVAQAEPESDKKALPEIRKENEELKDLISDKLATFPETQNWSVFLYDLKSSSTVSINTDHVFAAGSLYKLFLLEALESKLPYEKWAYTWMDDGTNIETCIYEMLRSSDSACGETLGDYIGWEYINDLAEKNGYKNTMITKNKGREATAADIGEFFIRLKKGQMLSDNARRFVFDALYQQILKKGITPGCGDCRTAVKIGEMQAVAHDAGIVTHGQRSYVLVIMSEGGNLKQVTAITKAIESR